MAATDANVVASEASRKRKVENLCLDNATDIDGSLVNQNEFVDSMLRENKAIKLVDAGGVIPVWAQNLQASIDAGFENIRIWTKNSQLLQTAAGGGFTPPVKTRPGISAVPPVPAMAKVMDPGAVTTALALPAPIGARLPAGLPFLQRNGSLTQAEIGYLSRWYNDDFGIALDDLHPAQLAKLRDFICGV